MNYLCRRESYCEIEDKYYLTLPVEWNLLIIENIKNDE